MKIGTRSLLFGVHQFIWHPLTVALAWRQMYGKWPNWKEIICIAVHDWGYWGCPEMDGEQGERHPELGARIAGWLFGSDYHDLVLYHSRHYARRDDRMPSKLCWADKLSIIYERWWTYLPRAILSGEIHEYRREAHCVGKVDISKTHRVWFDFMQRYFLEKAHRRDGAVIRPPVHPKTNPLDFNVEI